MYGYDVRDNINHEQYLALARDALDAGYSQVFTQFYLVNFIPALKYIPCKHISAGSVAQVTR